MIGRNRSKSGSMVYGQTTARLIASYQNLGLLVEVAAIGISRRDLPGNAFGAQDPGIRHNLVRSGRSGKRSRVFPFDSQISLFAANPSAFCGLR